VGYGYGEALHLLGYSVESYSFAAVGAAVFMGTVMRLPLTAMTLALEITYDYNVVVPTALNVVLLSFILQQFFDIRKLKAMDPHLHQNDDPAGASPSNGQKPTP